MDKITLQVSGAVVCTLTILVFLTACVTVFVPGVRAAETNNTFFTDWNVAQTGGTVHVDLITPPFILPDIVPDTTFTKGYYDDKGCPIGMTVGTKEAPRMRDAGFTSGALCRGACGPDCPTGRCKELHEIAIENRDKTGTCWYYGVIECPTDTGCQEHDSCYDYCEAHGYNFILDPCHLQCNGRCFDKYGYTTCTNWADLPGRTGKYTTKTFDFVFRPSYDQSSITFSYPPELYKNPPTIATTSTTQTSQPVPVTSTTIPATTIIPPTTTIPATTKPSGPDTRLTIIMGGGLSAEDMEGTTIGWNPEAREQSCSPTSGGAQCILKFPYGTSVVVSAFPSGGVRFVGWFGSCSGSGDCTVSMTKDKTVTAEFSKIRTTTTFTNYQDYCTANYPGSVYDPETQSCVFQRGTPTTTTNYASGSRVTLIPLSGECCPDEPCSTQIATATGGTPPYTFTSSSLAAGSAPPMGMIIDVNGFLTGKAPSRVGTYPLGVCVKDLAGQTDCGVSSIVVS
ncbi:MAG: hypothetical protein OS112_10425 [Methanoregula sp.]|nr:MAG: hypothetical protein OS112_10425 [Methanoregula sp.]